MNTFNGNMLGFFYSCYRTFFYNFNLKHEIHGKHKKKSNLIHMGEKQHCKNEVLEIRENMQNKRGGIQFRIPRL